MSRIGQANTYIMSYTYILIFIKSGLSNFVRRYSIPFDY